MIAAKNTRWKDGRKYVFITISLVIFSLIGMRLFSLQVLSRPAFLKQARANRIRAAAIEPNRGKIYDIKGKLLVENRPSYMLYVIPWAIKNDTYIIGSLAKLLNLEKEQIEDRISKRGWHTFQPVIIKRDVPFQIMARFETLKIDLQGAMIDLVAKREYPHPETVHLVGYVGERSISKQSFSMGRIGLSGKQGMESVYEEWLGGEPGIRYQQVDVSGKLMGISQDSPALPPESGWDLYLNVDSNLQRLAYELMDGRAGSVVAIDTRNWGVLVLLSSPSYDPSVFSGVLEPDVWQKLLADSTLPLFNRAVQGLYPPGSTYKMVLLAAAFEENLINDNYQVYCSGGLQIGRRFFKCWNAGGHGNVSWREALYGSCDAFFYTIGMKMGVDVISDYSRRFGLGKITSLDFDTESKGIIPDTKYLNNKYGKKKWTRGQIANISIGQGDVLTTPLQLVVYTAAIATGQLGSPRLAAKIINPNSSEQVDFYSEPSRLNISEATLTKIRQGMREVVSNPKGTGRRQYWRPLKIAGKTGTSQNPHGEDHALFVGFAPFENPHIAVAVIVEHGEHGSSTAAPIAGAIMERYIRDLYIGPYPRHRPFAPIINNDSLAANDSLTVVDRLGESIDSLTAAEQVPRESIE